MTFFQALLKILCPWAWKGIVFLVFDSIFFRICYALPHCLATWHHSTAPCRTTSTWVWALCDLTTAIANAPGLATGSFSFYPIYTVFIDPLFHPLVSPQHRSKSNHTTFLLLLLLLLVGGPSISCQMKMSKYQKWKRQSKLRPGSRAHIVLFLLLRRWQPFKRSPVLVLLF